MTSEVAVLTKQCVVLAADSAVSTGEKIFTTVNKVFALSKREPVGIMAYSSAQVMGVPIETVIKQFRRTDLRQGCHDHLEEYADQFEAFLQTNTSLFSDEARRQSLAAVGFECANHIQKQTYEKLKDRYPHWGHPNQKEAKEAFLEVLSECEQTVRSAQPLALPDVGKVRKAVAAAIAPELTEAIGYLGRFFPVSAPAKGRLKNLVLDHCLCDGDSGIETGFVIAGFGERDVFPRFRAFEFCHSALGIHKTRRRKEVDIGDKVSAHIEPFGQIDVMDTFLSGIAQPYRTGILSCVSQFFSAKKSEAEKAGQKLAAFVEALVLLRYVLRPDKWEEPWRLQWT